MGVSSIPSPGLSRTRLLALLLVWSLAQAACMPPSWGAGALLHPSRKPLQGGRPRGADELTVDSGGLTLRGWRMPASGPFRATLVYLHGAADNRVSGVGIAERFRRRGFDVLLFDSRAHGESDGDACTYGYHEKRDLARVLDAARPGPVALFGVSLGGAVAIQAAAEDPRIAGVVAVAAFADLRTVVFERAPFFARATDIERAFALAERRARFRVDEASPLRSAPKVSVPVLLVHGEQDRDTPPSHSRRLHAALGGEKRLIEVPGAGHGDALRPEVWRIVDRWIDRIVGGRPEPEEPRP